MVPDSQHSAGSRGYVWLILVATLAGAALRLATVPHFDFYGDELWTLQWSQRSVGEILGNFGGQGLTMHLYILLIKMWMYIVGSSPFLIKLPSLLAGLALIPLVFRLGKQWLDPHVATLAAVMTAVNLQMIIHSRTARVYTILAVGVLLSMALFSRVLRNGTKRDILLLSLVNACLLALSVQSLYIIFVQGTCLGLELLTRRPRAFRRLFSFAGGTGLSLGLAALFYHRAWIGVSKLAEASGATGPQKRTDALWLPAQKLWGPFRDNHMIVPWLMLTLLVIGSWIAWRHHHRTGRLLVLWAVLPSLIFFLQRSPLPSGSIARYLLPALPAQFLLIALGGLFCLRKLVPSSRQVWALGLAIFSFTIATSLSIGYRKSLVIQQEPTQQAIQRILQFVKPGDLVTSFPDQYHELIKLHVGDGAVKLPDLVRDPALPTTAILVILTSVGAPVSRFWKPHLEVERIGGPGYRRRLHLLSSQEIPAGPEALRPFIEKFYFGFLDAVAKGERLHHRPISHYRYLSRIHLRLSLLAEAAGNSEESRQHLLLKKNPRAWDGDMTQYSAVMEKLREVRARR